MSEPQLPATFDGASVFMVGIKGTGMAALCELLIARGARIRGSDTTEVFYTDAILSRLNVPVIEDFAAEALPGELDLLIHSAAYDPESHPQLRAARDRGVPVLVYTDALGLLSRDRLALAVAGVHGKTTTTAMLGSLLRRTGLPGEVLVGSAVPIFDGFSTFSGGAEFFVAETCEYRRNFLAFNPDILVVTSIEADHLDYYRDEDDVSTAFLEFAQKLPEHGELIYCADDPGAVRLATAMRERRGDILYTPYGRHAEGSFAITEIHPGAGATSFRLAGVDAELRLRIPGDHNVLNAGAAVAGLHALARRRAAAGPAQTAAAGPAPSAAARPAQRSEPPSAAAALAPSAAAPDPATVAAGLHDFTGTRRRSEIIGERDGVLYLDDYAHHPTAVATTLRGFRHFYPGRRIVVSFMSHTYSRTAGLLEEFARAFGDADVVFLHKIYASAREHFDGRMSGEDLAEAMARHHPDVRYIAEVDDALPHIRAELGPGDIFLSMGAGNNWVLSHRLYEGAAA